MKLSKPSPRRWKLSLALVLIQPLFLRLDNARPVRSRSKPTTVSWASRYGIMRASQGLAVNRHRLLDMPEAVAAEVLAAEPPRDDDNVLAQRFPLEHAKDDHACPSLSIIVLDQLITADERRRIVSGLGDFLVMLQLSCKRPRLVPGVTWPAKRRNRINSVCPGLVESSMGHSMLTDDQYQASLSKIHLARPADATEIADVVQFILSPASSYTTGALIPVSGAYR